MDAQDKLASVAGQLGREVHVFVSPVAGNSNGPKQIPDEPDEFYEFTNEDYFCLMASKKEDNILKTKKLRDAEKAARRTNFSKTVIRVQFPDNYIIEADFEPSESISTLMDFLRKVIAQPELPFYIYTTPPKKRITDLMKDFYSSNLVPRALVRFQYDVPEEEDKVPFLRDDIAALCDLHLFVGQKEEQKPADPSLTVEPPAQVLDNKPAVKKAVKPKWLKM
ncbi:hypothetical protein SUGI_0924140 [Cryptomeria japonica]|uniref:plant UBX domain-containing protein 1 isoform X2 n=1 Tax=Cryptomeria japonica TaxID=3369 RepID=UPI002414A510|nr:plant UBX domain-containing protein 1 isoform X2 [Cryptomeria japonica]GLJ44238.1 hypothetical protein SUGI_0924140 [Cryptomeria japonica]